MLPPDLELAAELGGDLRSRRMIIVVGDSGIETRWISAFRGISAVVITNDARPLPPLAVEEASLHCGTSSFERLLTIPKLVALASKYDWRDWTPRHRDAVYALPVQPSQRQPRRLPNTSGHTGKRTRHTHQLHRRSP